MVETVKFVDDFARGYFSTATLDCDIKGQTVHVSHYIAVQPNVFICAHSNFLVSICCLYSNNNVFAVIFV